MAIDLHIHDVDLIRFLMGGDPDAINSTVHTSPDETIDHVWSCYKYGDATVSCEASWDYPASMPFDAGFRVRFEKATVLSAPDRKVMVYPEDGEPYEYQVPEHLCYVDEVEDFIRCILEDRESEINPPESSLVSLKIALAEKLSANRGSKKIYL